MANVKFFRGQLANLPKTFTAADEGSFYLTTDSKQLFNVINASGTYKLIPLGENITQFESTATIGGAADYAGQFAYIKDGNIFMVSVPKDGASGQYEWVQVNSQSPVVTGNDLTAIKQANVVKIKSTVSLSDGSSFNDDVAITGTGAVTIDTTGDGDGIVINVPVISLETSAVSGSGATGVKLEVGEGKLSIIGDGNTATVTFDNTNKVATISANSLESLDAYHGSSSTPVAAPIDSKEGFKIEVADDSNHSATAYLNPVIKTLDTNDAGVKFEDGVAVINTYSKAQIDKLKIEADAMHFKGVAGGISIKYPQLPTENVEIGDTFKIIGSVTAVQAAKEGDLVIANSSDGKEDAQGHIPTSKLVWDLVPAGDDVDDYTLGFKSGSHQIVLHRSQAEAGSLSLAAANAKITLTDSGTASDGIITIGHGAIGAKDADVTASKTSAISTSEVAEGADFDITFVNAIGLDATGHVAEIKPEKVSIKGNKLDTSSGTDAMSVVAAGSTSAIGGTATLKDTWSVSDLSNASAGSNHNVSLSSSTLAVSASASSGNGTFAIDMVWGTF